MTSESVGQSAILIIGGGGHAKGLIEALRIRAPDSNLAILDPAASGAVLGVPVIGTDDFIERAHAEGFRRFAIGLGGVGNNMPRARLFDRARRAGLSPVAIIHPSAVISPSAHLGDGTQCLSGALVCADALLGENVILNTGAIVEHDCRIGDHVHVASGAVLAGNVTIGDFAHIGAGATLLQSIMIGNAAIIAAGAVIIANVPAGRTFGGVPARDLAPGKEQVE